MNENVLNSCLLLSQQLPRSSQVLNIYQVLFQFPAHLVVVPVCQVLLDPKT